MTDGERKITTKAQRVTIQIEQILKRDFKVKWFKPKLEDQLRLLQLQQWGSRYKVSLSWILQTILPIWRQRFARYQTGQGLGVAITTLVGKKSEQIIKEEAEKLEGQNILVWKANEQERQFRLERKREEREENWEKPRSALVQYQRRMSVERRERERWARIQAKRPYRNSPWR